MHLAQIPGKGISKKKLSRQMVIFKGAMFLGFLNNRCTALQPNRLFHGLITVANKNSAARIEVEGDRNATLNMNIITILSDMTEELNK